MTWYHGTSERVVAELGGAPLRSPHLTDRYELAEYYASCASDEDGTAPIVLVTHPHKDTLRYDRAAMDEPVLTSPEERDKAWAEAERAHPEWVDGEYLLVPPGAWEVSRKGVGSVRAEGPVRWER